MRRRLLIVGTILTISIVFALVTTTLYINGFITIGTNPQDFNSNVIFTSATTYDESNALLLSDNKTINFTTRDLSLLGEEVILDFVVRNNSRQYDADATIYCDYDNNDSKYNEYVNITINPSNFEIKAQEEKNGQLTIRLVKSFIGEIDDNSAQIGFNCRIDSYAKEKEI